MVKIQLKHSGQIEQNEEDGTNLPFFKITDDDILNIVQYKSPINEAETECEFKKACNIIKEKETSVSFRQSIALDLNGNLLIATPDNARSILQLISRIRKHENSGKGVISFAVFGGPSSGKSYIAKKIQGAVDSEGIKFETIERNISQFENVSRLIETFEEIQSISLQGKIPFVLFDEFDTSFNNNRAGWLQYFLIPMQDGKFRNGSVDQDLGKCIFVFIGGTYKNANEFSTWALADEPEDAKFCKGPDFHSRLDRCLTIPSVEITPSSPHGEAELTRAIIIRTKLKELKKLKSIEGDVLFYLLHVPLKHGVRSLEKIINASEISKANRFSAIYLPSKDVLQIHVGGKDKDNDDFYDVNRFYDKYKFGECGELAKETIKLKWYEE